MYRETMTIKGYPISIFQESTESPRLWTESVLVTAHKHFSNNDAELPVDASSIKEAFIRHLAEKDLLQDDIIFVPIYLYEHSGISLSTSPFSCRWDSGQLGYLYEVKEHLRQEFQVAEIDSALEALIIQRLQREIEEFSAWLNGETFAYYIEGLQYACGGFYGSDHEASGLISSATEQIEYLLQQKMQKQIAKLKQLIRHHVPLLKRSQLLYE